MLKEITRRKFSGSTGYTEAELYNSMAGIEVAVYGPGTKEVIHKANEYVEVKALEASTKAFTELIKRWCL